MKEKSIICSIFVVLLPFLLPLFRHFILYSLLMSSPFVLFIILFCCTYLLLYALYIFISFLPQLEPCLFRLLTVFYFLCLVFCNNFSSFCCHLVDISRILSVNHAYFSCLDFIGMIRRCDLFLSQTCSILNL